MRSAHERHMLMASILPAGMETAFFLRVDVGLVANGNDLGQRAPYKRFFLGDDKMGTVTVSFNFLDLECLDADYERSVEEAIRVASLFQACASKEKLGECFLHTEADPFALYIQRVRFEALDPDMELLAARSVQEFASSCRSRLRGDYNEAPQQYVERFPI